MTFSAGGCSPPGNLVSLHLARFNHMREGQAWPWPVEAPSSLSGHNGLRGGKAAMMPMMVVINIENQLIHVWYNNTSYWNGSDLHIVGYRYHLFTIFSFKFEYDTDIFKYKTDVSNLDFIQVFTQFNSKCILLDSRQNWPPDTESGLSLLADMQNRAVCWWTPTLLSNLLLDTTPNKIFISR